MERGNIVISYMLRCCFAQDDVNWRFQLRQVQTGEEKYFTSLEEVQSYIKQQLTKIPDEEGQYPPYGRD